MKIIPEHKSLFYKSATTTALAVGSLWTPWEITRIMGLTTLMGMSYGVANDLISSWGCSKHFNKSHISDRSHLRNQPPQGLHSSLNAVVCGMFGYWHISSTFGIALAAAARAPIFKIKIKATQITPYLVIGSAVITLVVQLGNRILKKYVKNTCDIQHPTSYGLFVTGHILLTTVVFITRIGVRLIK